MRKISDRDCERLGISFGLEHKVPNTEIYSFQKPAYQLFHFSPLDLRVISNFEAEVRNEIGVYEQYEFNDECVLIKSGISGFQRIFHPEHQCDCVAIHAYNLILEVFFETLEEAQEFLNTVTSWVHAKAHTGIYASPGAASF